MDHTSLMIARRQVLYLGGGVLGLAVLGGCSYNKATDSYIFTGLSSTKDDIAMGEKEHQAVAKQYGGVYQSRRLQAYVQSVGRRLEPFVENQKFPYQFTVLNTPLVNAFALPGGYVYVTRGLLELANNEAELAGVMAHELGHVNARHSAQQMGEQKAYGLGIGLLSTVAGIFGGGGLANVTQTLGQGASQGLIQGHSREQESEADRLGIRYMAKAGYDPHAMALFLNSLRNQAVLQAEEHNLPLSSVDKIGWLASHPTVKSRVVAARNLAQKYPVVHPRIEASKYLHEISGLPYGGNVQEGLVKNNTFYHKGLRFSFAVPQGFTVRNQPDKIILEDKKLNAFGVFHMYNGQKKYRPRSYIEARMQQATHIQTLKVHNIPTAMGSLDLATKNGSYRGVIVAYQGTGGKIFEMLLLAKAPYRGNVSQQFEKIIKSFQRLSLRQANAIKDRHIQIHKVRRTDTIEKLARRMSSGRFQKERFQVLNDIITQTELQQRQFIKLVK